MKINDFVISVATANGSGSQSSNTILVKTLFRMGIPVGAKNLFPSNIQGLPTWFTIRVNPKGYTSRLASCDLMVAMNPATIEKDTQDVCAGGVFLYNSSLKVTADFLRNDTINIGVPFKDLVDEVTDSPKLKKLLVNMVYVGTVAACIGLDRKTLNGVINDQFGDKPSLIESNQNAVDAGWNYAVENKLEGQFPFSTRAIENGNQGKILIDGNTSAALGALYGGCTFLSWYPITPSSSIPESFERYASQYRRDPQGKKAFAVVQAEDELSAIAMVVGAGWAGARSMTATSGPGLSLMAEAAGLSYFAEIPAVIWDIQRGGPSTGLPTRTQQCDLLSAATLSHGDTQHIVLIPGNPEECFEFGQKALDLAEQLQTLVIVLSDLDLGMNLWMSDEFKPSTQPFERGKVLSKSDLESLSRKFGRYDDVDGDGIPYRTLPGTAHPDAAYFTRGTGHDAFAKYTENNEVYQQLQDRLKRKYETAKGYVPEPKVQLEKDSAVGLIAYGSSDFCVPEVLEELKNNKIGASYLRLRALPFSDAVRDFIDRHERIYVIEQNRDAQLLTIIKAEMPDMCKRLHSVTEYDGLPLSAAHVMEKILEQELKLKG